MGTVHIALKDGTQQEVDEEQLQALWAQAKLPSTALYWQPGMAGWEPLVGYFAAKRGLEIPAATAESFAAATGVASAPRYRFRKDPRWMTLLLLALLGIGLVTESLRLYSEVSRNLLLREPDMTEAAAEAADTQVEIYSGINLVVFILTAMLFLNWIYRANENSHGFGARGMRFTPGWAIGWYFVPILNLLRPFQVMREIWQVSGDPAHWRRERGSLLLVLWWCFWLAVIVLDRVLAGMDRFWLAHRIPTVEDIIVYTNIVVIAAVCCVALQVVAIAMVMAISRRQWLLVKGASGRDG